MLFNSPQFLFVFLPLAVIVHAVLPSRARLPWLVAVSVGYLALWGVWTLVAVGCALCVAAGAIAAIDRGRRSAGLWLGVVALTALLCIPKTLQWWRGAPDTAMPVLLVVGLSFVALNLASLVIDRYRGRVEGRPTPGLLLAFGSCFAYIAAGPLVRWREVAPQLRSGARATALQVPLALCLIASGLAKKTLLADPIGLRLDQLLSYGPPPGLVGAWLTTAGFGAQIYFDFSGYSDMALGVGLLLGLKLPPNFDAPYRASTPADFWRRWHMTLSAWVRDYVYLGLGLGRSHGRAIANMIVAMALVGLWHGFSWTFLLWGIYHGLLLAGYYGARALRMPARVPMPSWAGRLLTFLLITVGWAFFRAASVPEALTLLSSLVGWNGAGSIGEVRALAGASFLMLTATALLLTQVLPEPWQLQLRPRATTGIACGVLFALGVMALGGENPFLYLQY
jgi:alginate O-acetyltransferase complex protein AlgI